MKVVSVGKISENARFALIAAIDHERHELMKFYAGKFSISNFFRIESKKKMKTEEVYIIDLCAFVTWVRLLTFFYKHQHVPSEFHYQDLYSRKKEENCWLR